MNLGNSRQQTLIDDYFDYSGTILVGGKPQLMLPQRRSCSHLVLANNSAYTMMVQFGVAPGTAVLTNGVVTSVIVNDAGFGFLVPPDVVFYGGGNNGDLISQGATMPGWPVPSSVAHGRAILGTSSISGSNIASIEIDGGGSGYLVPPFVYIRPARTDPTGVGIPSATVGIPLGANGGSYYINGTACPTTSLSIWCSTTGAPYVCKFMP